MKVVQCGNGHFFDADRFRSCPQCGAGIAVNSEAPVKKEKKKLFGRKSKKDVNNMSDGRPPYPYGNTAPGYNDPPFRPQPPVQQPGVADNDYRMPQDKQQYYPETGRDSIYVAPQTSGAPERNNFFTGNEIKNESKSESRSESKTLDIWSLKREEGIRTQEEPKEEISLEDEIKNASAADSGKTLSFFNSMVSEANAQKKPSGDPVVGWLVCIEGNHFGESFELVAGRNSIGRNTDNRVVLDKDNSVSREKHAFIIYEPKARSFIIQAGAERGLTYLNDSLLMNADALRAGDKIGIGECRLMFVQLCGESFSWEDYISKESDK